MYLKTADMYGNLSVLFSWRYFQTRFFFRVGRILLTFSSGNDWHRNLFSFILFRTEKEMYSKGISYNKLKLLILYFIYFFEFS